VDRVRTVLVAVMAKRGKMAAGAVGEAAAAPSSFGRVVPSHLAVSVALRFRPRAARLEREVPTELAAQPGTEARERLGPPCAEEQIPARQVLRVRRAAMVPVGSRDPADRRIRHSAPAKSRTGVSALGLESASYLD